MYIMYLSIFNLRRKRHVKMSIEVDVIQTGSFCIDNTNFTIFVTPPNRSSTNFRPSISQDQAKTECSALDNFSLGPMVNEEEFLAVRTFLSNNKELFPFNRSEELHNFGFYVGLEAFNGQPVGGGDTSLFTFVEDSFNQNEAALNFYHSESATFPWSVVPAEPNNFGGAQDCGQLVFFKVNDFEIDGFLDDIDCDQGTGFICRGTCEDFDNDIDDDEAEKNMIFLSGMVTCGTFVLICSLLLCKLQRERWKLNQKQLKLLSI